MAKGSLLRRKAQTRFRRPVVAANPLSAALLLAIWRELDKRSREQVLTAAFGMLRAQTDFKEGTQPSKVLQRVLFRSNARAPFEKVLLCGPGKCLGDLPRHDRTLGRWQRRIRWLVNGNLIAPDWREIRSGFSRGMLPETPTPRSA